MTDAMDLIRDAIAAKLCMHHRSISASRCDSTGQQYDYRPGMNHALHRFRCGVEVLVQLPSRAGKPLKGLGKLPCPDCYPEIKVQRGLVVVEVRRP